MARSKKRKQATRYIGNSTLVPEFQDNQHDNRIRKRARTTHDISYMSFFESSMTETLTSLIVNKMNKSDDKSMEKNLQKLKDYVTNLKILPSGLLQTAVQKANNAISQQTGVVSVLSSSAYRNRLDNEAPERLIDIWKKYATVKEFDRIVCEEKNKETVTIPIEETQPTLIYKTCTVAIGKILRSDLPLAIKGTVKNKLMEAMANTSDFQAHFLSVLQMLLITMKKYELSTDRDLITSSVDILSVLPEKFVETNKLKPTISAPHSPLIPSKNTEMKICHYFQINIYG